MAAAPIWTPDPATVDRARITDFARFAASRTAATFNDYPGLLAWSVRDLDAFWGTLYDYFDVPGEGRGKAVLADDRMPGAVWFPGARLNYVDQVFRGRPRRASR